MSRRRASLVSKASLLVLAALVGVALFSGCTSDEASEAGDTGEETAETAADDATEAPEEPAPAGEDLDVVVQPPTDTIAMLDPSAADAGSAYGIEFEVYGWGPEQDTLVIYVSSSAAVDEGGTTFDFAEENVVVVADADSLDMVREGGSYSGTLVLVEREGVLVPELHDVETL